MAIIRRIIRLFKKIYIRPLSPLERQRLYFVKMGVPRGVNLPFEIRPMTVKELRKFEEREELYR